ncbi:MAG: hypothetical protein M3Q07_10760, partial [Pseudobdellovibrionaceae bacterium]|nr:hypothetical protein [Pseudobdellovibrionaceae bacterium]
AYINHGISRWFYGAYGEAEELVLTSFRFISDLKEGRTKAMLDNTAHAVLANIYFDDKRLQQSWERGLTSLKLAQNSGYRRGIGLAHIRLAELKALQNETADAVQGYEKGMSFISPSEILLLVYESGSAIYRLHGDLDQSEKIARHALSQSQSYTGEGTFYVQLAQLEKARERHDKVKEYLAMAKRSFRKSGCLLRLESIQDT